MFWSSDHFPTAMRSLAPDVRVKAIEVANVLIEESMDESKSIRMAISMARAWGARRTRSVRAEVELDQLQAA